MIEIVKFTFNVAIAAQTVIIRINKTASLKQVGIFFMIMMTKKIILMIQNRSNHTKMMIFKDDYTYLLTHRKSALIHFLSVLKNFVI